MNATAALPPRSEFTSPVSSAIDWPTLTESHEVVGGMIESGSTSADKWEIVSSIPSPAGVSPANTEMSYAAKSIPCCVSTPDFGHYNCYSSESSCTEVEESDHVNMTENGEEELSVVLIPPILSSPPGVGEKAVKVKRVPSFKDAILLNAQEKTREEERKQAEADQMRKKKISFSTSQKMAKTKFIVKDIKRCAKSSPDLRSLARMEDAEDDGDDCGYGGSVVRNKGDDTESLGMSDADEFYARKRHGSVSRRNGLKIRPDEAKRKEMIMYKKNLQRMKQRQRGA